MFTDIPVAILARMKFLEEKDEEDRKDGTSHWHRLRQITPDTGRFIALMAASAPKGNWIEIGTSAGYSALWISLACRQLSGTLTTYEIFPPKVEQARETFSQAGVEDVIHLVEDDALKGLEKISDVSFCFLDAEKDVYLRCYGLVIPKMVSGGMLIADNATTHKDDLSMMIDRALTDDRVDAMVVPVGKGELVCRKI